MNITLIAGTNRANSRTGRVTRRIQERFEHHGVSTTLLDLVDLPVALLSPEAYDETPRGFCHSVTLCCAAMDCMWSPLNTTAVILERSNSSSTICPFPRALNNDLWRLLGLPAVCSGIFGVSNSYKWSSGTEMPTSFQDGFLFRVRAVIWTRRVVSRTQKQRHDLSSKL